MLFRSTGYDFEDFIGNYINSPDEYLMAELRKTAKKGLFDVEVTFSRSTQQYMPANINIKTIKKIEEEELDFQINNRDFQQKINGGRENKNFRLDERLNRNPTHYTRYDSDELFQD